MRIVMIALGSRGDVQPFVALGLGLRAVGYQITIAAAADYATLVQAYGIDFAPVGGYVQELMNFALVNQMLDGVQNPLYFARATLREVEPLLTPIVADCWRAAEKADLLLVASLGYWVGLHLVEKRCAVGHPCPMVAVHMHPLYPSAARPHVNFPPLPRWMPGRAHYNRLSHHLGWHGFGQALRRPLNRARQQALGLPPLSPMQLYHCIRRPVPTLFAYSPTLLPPDGAELPPDSLVSGDWPLPAPPGWQPPETLATFLAAGPPPVLVSFGSILGGRNPERMTQLLVDAIAASGHRGLIYRGWGDLGNIALLPTMLAIDAVPHDWLLPQVAAVIHHGGAGVTAAALRARCPAVIVPVFGDQLLWSERLAALGVAPAPIPRHHLTVQRLATAITQATSDSAYLTNLQAIATALQSEDGVRQAVTWLHQSLPLTIHH